MELAADEPKATGFSLVASKLWGSLSQEDRQPFIDQTEKQKEAQEARDLASAPGPQKAKPPATPYNLWCAANRDRIMELAAKEPKTTGFSLVASKLWGSLSEEDRQPFVEEAARDRAQFKKESRYMGKGPSRDPIAPKLPLTAYMIYARDHRGEVAASVAGGVIEHGKELGRRWQALGEEERKPYFDQASEARVKFEQALAEYKSSDAYKQFQTKVQAEMSKKRPAPKDPDAPKRPTNAYMLFSESCRGELLQSGMSVPEVGKELGRRWKELSEEDRKPWQEKLSSLHTEYEEKLQQYTFSGGAAKRPRQASDSTAPQLEGEEPSQVKMERQTRGKGSGTKKVMVGGE